MAMLFGFFARACAFLNDGIGFHHVFTVLPRLTIWENVLSDKNMVQEEGSYYEYNRHWNGSTLDRSIKALFNY